MGDRTSCTLQIGGRFPAHLVERFDEILDACGGQLHELSIVEALQNKNCSFSFDEVNYATMDEDLRSFLCDEAKVSWTWSWAPGGSYPEGVEMHDAGRNEGASWATAEGALVIGVDDAVDETVLAQAAAWSLFNERLTLRVAHTAHERLFQASDDAAPETFLPDPEEALAILRERRRARAASGATPTALPTALPSAPSPHDRFEASEESDR